MIAMTTSNSIKVKPFGRPKMDRVDVLTAVACTMQR
jgi:hypothetical protein